MALSEADTRAKLIDPAIHLRGWTEDLIRREETAGTIEIVGGRAPLARETAPSSREARGTTPRSAHCAKGS